MGQKSWNGSQNGQWIIPQLSRMVALTDFSALTASTKHTLEKGIFMWRDLPNLLE
jgi:hypothetical protein